MSQQWQIKEQKITTPFAYLMGLAFGFKSKGYELRVSTKKQHTPPFTISIRNCKGRDFLRPPLIKPAHQIILKVWNIGYEKNMKLRP